MVSTEIDRQTLVDGLNDLILLAEDSHQALLQTAAGSQDDELKAVFQDLAEGRAQIIRELQLKVVEQGAGFAGGGTLRGGAVRLINGLKGAVMGTPPADQLAAMLRAEDKLYEHFENFAAAEGHAETIAMIQEQCLRLQIDRDRLAGLEAKIVTEDLPASETRSAFDRLLRRNRKVESAAPDITAGPAEA